jgi:hypothetical protein
MSIQRINKLVEQHGFIHIEVSAKTGDKVYESIRDFGIGIAKTKMERLGISWFQTGNSPNTLPSSQSGAS